MTERDRDLLIRFLAVKRDATFREMRAFLKANVITQPSHRCTFFDGTGPAQIVSETFPIRRLKLVNRLYCKYCYAEHRNWWEMDPKDYGGYRVALCGHCEHTSSLDDD
jgi:hypothetical protein